MNPRNSPRTSPPPTRSGFSLIEVLVAVLILEVGLVGCAGTLVLAQRQMTAAERIHVATQVTASVADSLLVGPMSGSGETATSWGRVRWTAEASGIRLRAEDVSGTGLLDWWIPLSGSV